MDHLRKTSFYDVERLREEIWQHTYGRIPADILTRALLKNYEKLDAKKKLFFAFEGRVTDERTIENDEVQLRAANAIMDFAGAKARERDTKPAIPVTRLRYDPNSGVMEIVVGTPDRLQELPESFTTIEHEVLPIPPAVVSPSASNEQEDSESVELPSPSDFTWIKSKRGMSDEIRKMLLDEIEGGEKGG